LPSSSLRTSRSLFEFEAGNSAAPPGIAADEPALRLG
jgi:hypothetical protein